jgi:6-pyruvoyltetrahydropterin/6-carboxytetrahydropterin synthase
MKLTKEFEISTGHRLPNHKGGCSNLHGHNYKVIISIEFSNNDIADYIKDQGFYIDFGEIKKTINEVFDHQFIMWKEDPLADKLASCPGVRLVVYVPSAENISNHMCGLIKEMVQDNKKVMQIGVKLYETSNSFIEMQYGNS